MINISSIQGRPRKFLKKMIDLLLPKSAIIPVLQGRAMGKLWKREYGDDGCWLGSYEYHVQQALSRHFQKDFVFYDIGAHSGFFTLFASSFTKFIYSFEPDTRNFLRLEWHVKTNKIEARLFNIAISDKDGELDFLENKNNYVSRVSGAGITPELEMGIENAVKVNCRTIDSMVENKEILPPDIMKIDVEGYMEEVLRGAKKTILKYKPIIVLEVPGNQPNCLNLLPAGYNLEKLDKHDNYLAVYNK